MAAGHVFVALPPLYRIDIGKEVFYALDEAEKEAILKKHENSRGQKSVTRFKGLGEMNPIQLRETTMSADTRRLVQLVVPEVEVKEVSEHGEILDFVIEEEDMNLLEDPMEVFNKLLARNQRQERKEWIESKHFHQEV